jgi:hypothetical protein
MSTHVALKLRVLSAIAEEPSLTRRGVRRLRLFAASVAAVGAAAASWSGLTLEPFQRIIAQVLTAFSAALIGALVAGRLTDAHTWVPRRPVSPSPERERSAVLH